MTTQTLTNATTEIQEILDAAFPIFVAGDLQGVMDYYTDDAMLALGKDVLQGKEVLRGFYQQFFEMFTIAENYPIETKILSVNDDAVVANAHEKIVLKPKVEGVPEVDTELMVTFTFRRENGNWLCCYEQASLHTPLF